MAEPSLNVRLTGTEEEPARPRVLRAGALTAALEAGNLRHIRVDGVEVLRAVSFIVRDRNWGTYAPRIDDLSVEETGNGFAVSYGASVGDDRQQFAYRARITGRPDEVVFEAEGEAGGEFTTNRTGFVVLHPASVAGEAVAVERVDGSVAQESFPRLIDPMQPMKDLRALTHRPAPGLSVECRMEGDTFEMEDQRNWTDASFKTYVRPLALPWPYVLPAGETIRQRVNVRVTGTAPAVAAGGSALLELGDEAGPVPPVGVGLAREEHAGTVLRQEDLAAARFAHVVVHYDPRRGDDEASLAEGVRLARALGAEAWLEAVIVSVDDYAREVAALGALGLPFARVLLSPAADLKSTLPGSVWPAAAPLNGLYRAARAAFPGALVGGGMMSFFTELNRKRPPVEGLDYVSFTTSPLVHAGDDVTVMENVATLTAVVESARAFAGGKPLAVGPSTLGMRLNPYGEAPFENPGNVRQAMSEADPRQRGIFGAAWAVGHFARLAAGGVSAITFGGTTGPQGLVSVPGAAHPFYGETGLYPIYHVVRALAGWAGRPLRAVRVPQPEAMQAVAVGDGRETEMLLANLTGEVLTVELPFVGAVATLDAGTFVDAAADRQFLDRPTPAGTAELTLTPYAVARVTAG